jgi:prepilin-type N-terminal cleavage/methylation domain-containing protein
MGARKISRGFTVVELLISMTILGIVLALAIVEFAMVFNHNSLMQSNLTADQNARIVMARVTNELRQAMPDVTDSNYAIVISPTAPPASTAPSAATTVSFHRVHSGTNGLTQATPDPIPTDVNGNPMPCYDTVTLTYDAPSQTITKTVTAAQVTTDCPSFTTTSVLSRNVAGFGVTAQSATLFDVDVQTAATKGNYGIYDLNSQVAMGYKP